MIRKPLFSIGDEVVFAYEDREHGDREHGDRELEGTVEIVDYRRHEREWFKGCNWSYDILVDEHPDFGGGPCLCKHIPECDVHPARSDDAKPI